MNYSRFKGLSLICYSLVNLTQSIELLDQLSAYLQEVDGLPLDKTNRSECYAALKLKVACASSLGHKREALSSCMQALNLTSSLPSMSVLEHAMLLRRCASLSLECDLVQQAHAILLRHATLTRDMPSSGGGSAEREAARALYHRVSSARAKTRSSEHPAAASATSVLKAAFTSDFERHRAEETVRESTVS